MANVNEQATETMTAPEQPPTARPVVLVVDDHPVSRVMAETHLLGAGYDVVGADSGERALELFGTRVFDLVILDIIMPGIDGYETCRRLRRMPGGSDTAIVFLTVLDDPEADSGALDSGADDFLSKPIRRTELLLRARSLIRIRRLLGDLQASLAVISRQHEALKEAQEARQELISLIVHDLKNPLTTIMGYSELMTADPSAPKTVLTAAQGIFSASKGMSRMVMDMLEVSRAENGELNPAFAPVDLGKLLSDVVKGFELRRAQIPLEVRVQLPDPHVRADPYLLQRVLENLLDNAFKYTGPAGSVVVSASLATPGKYELAVTDRGKGVPEEYREKIFQAYVRLPRDAARHSRVSHGLGLVFCRLAVEACGGEIWVDENPEGGSCFHIRLPVDPRLEDTG